MATMYTMHGPAHSHQGTHHAHASHAPTQVIDFGLSHLVSNSNPQKVSKAGGTLVRSTRLFLYP